MAKRRFCRNLIGKKFNTIFKQFDMLIINFGEPITNSIQVGSMVRICEKDKIIMTISDEFFTKEGLSKSDKIYEQLEKDELINDPNSLLAENLKKVNKLLENRIVRNIKINQWMDLFIYFDNNIIIQLFPDCLMRDYEYYRYIEFLPYWAEDSNDFYSVHHIIWNNHGQIAVKIE